MDANLLKSALADAIELERARCAGRRPEADAALIALGAKFREIETEAERERPELSAEQAEEVLTALNGQAYRIEQAIADASAQSIAGALVKLRLLGDFIKGPSEKPDLEERLSDSLVRDLERMAAP